MPIATSLVIVPTLNERENILALVDALLELPCSVDILVADDNSADGTAVLVQSHRSMGGRLNILNRTGKPGLGLTYVDSFLWALERDYRFIAHMDADFSHDPISLPPLLERAKCADVAIGSRYCPGGGTRGWPLSRRAVSRFGNFYVRSILNLNAGDATSGFRCYTRRALEAIDVRNVMSEGYAFMVEMTYRAHLAGLLVQEEPICFTDRRAGKSKMGARVLVESARMPWRLRRLGQMHAWPARQ